ncbi:glycoside hydrolase family 32 protein, partial [bacterium]|nr:glycoside hydrolase family 32 protein [bacterium]
CPDFFELAVDGDPARKKWVLLGANTEYAVGTFDGTTFTAEAERLPGQLGPPNVIYAGQSFNDVPDGRRLFICWWLTPTKGMPFTQSMTLPLELKLATTPTGPRLTFQPVKELEALRQKTHSLGPLTLAPGDKNPLAGVSAELVEIRAENVRGAKVTYDAKTGHLVVNGHRAPAPMRDGRVRLAIYCDRTGIEAFAADGLCYLPQPFQPPAENRSFLLEVQGGAVKIPRLEVYELKSIWGKS